MRNLSFAAIIAALLLVGCEREKSSSSRGRTTRRAADGEKLTLRDLQADPNGFAIVDPDRRRMKLPMSFRIVRAMDGGSGEEVMLVAYLGGEESPSDEQDGVEEDVPPNYVLVRVRRACGVDLLGGETNANCRLFVKKFERKGTVEMGDHGDELYVITVARGDIYYNYDVMSLSGDNMTDTVERDRPPDPVRPHSYP